MEDSKLLPQKGGAWMLYLLLWILGVPLGLILLLFLFGVGR
jgi:hypothetical protein